MNAIVAYQPRAHSLRLETKTGAGDFAYLDFGPGERPVDAVFLHANGFNARTYRTILAPLASDLRILALDLRGHGRTRAPAAAEGRNTWLDLGQDLDVFLETLDLKTVVLAGHSMGGTLSLFAAADLPERVRALALFDPVVLPPERRAGEPASRPAFWSWPRPPCRSRLSRAASTHPQLRQRWRSILPNPWSTSIWRWRSAPGGAR